MNSLSSLYILNKRSIDAFLLAIGYGVCFYLFHFFLYKVELVSYQPNSMLIANWDGSWYEGIARNGYSHSLTNSSNTGFYILFPLLWKLSHLGTWGVSALNLLLFAIGFSLLVKIHPVSLETQLVLLSTPGVFYFFIPYSESTFFILCSLCLYGISTRKDVLIFISLFLIALTRSVSVLLIPTFLVIMLLMYDQEKIKDYVLGYLKVYFLPLILGTLTFSAYQYYSTGAWDAYYYQQSNFWGHKPAGPRLPFSNPYLGVKILWIHALYVFISFAGSIYLIKALYAKYKKRIQVKDEVLWLSVAFLFFTVIINFYFSPMWGIAKTTNLISLSRYISATPFFFILSFRFFDLTFKKVHFFWVFLVSSLFWLLFGSYEHIQTWLVFEFNTLILLLYMLYANKYSWAGMILFALNLMIQVSYFQVFISGKVLPE